MQIIFSERTRECGEYERLTPPLALSAAGFATCTFGLFENVFSEGKTGQIRFFLSKPFSDLLHCSIGKDWEVGSQGET